MSKRDYYKVLDVPRTATEADIKKAYRRLAMKFHPDRNPGDNVAEERFKEINEANEVLTDPAKRKQIYQDFNRAFAAGSYNLWNWYTEWGVGAYDEVHNLTGTKLPDGTDGAGMTWGWHQLTEAWVEQ